MSVEDIIEAASAIVYAASCWVVLLISAWSWRASALSITRVDAVFERVE